MEWDFCDWNFIEWLISSSLWRHIDPHWSFSSLQKVRMNFDLIKIFFLHSFTEKLLTAHRFKLHIEFYTANYFHWIVHPFLCTLIAKFNNFLTVSDNSSVKMQHFPKRCDRFFFVEAENWCAIDTKCLFLLNWLQQKFKIRTLFSASGYSLNTKQNNALHCTKSNFSQMQTPQKIRSRMSVCSHNNMSKVELTASAIVCIHVRNDIISAASYWKL